MMIEFTLNQQIRLILNLSSKTMFKSEKNVEDFKIIMYAIILRIHRKVS